MRIIPDNDDLSIIPYYEEIGEFSYFYELYVRIYNMKSKIVITNSNVLINFKNGKLAGFTMLTSIIPDELFSGSRLIWDEILQIIKILEDTYCEGELFNSHEQFEIIYKKWKGENG